MTDKPEVAAEAPEVSVRAPEEIGLLLVHGMGEQRPLEHLQGTARELASHISAVPGLIRLSVLDSLADTEKADETKSVVIDAVFRRPLGEQQVRLHLHEVWWADLGIRGGLWEQVKFWFWGLGQWAAEVLRKGDPSRNTEKLMSMPRFGHQASAMQRPSGWRQAPSRLLLAGAGLLAILTFFTWSAAKRVISFLAQTLPEPSLIFLFVGDVKTYEQAGGPGKGSLADPDQPMRATIRRRMIARMVEMAARRDLDRWYIFAHSLGTIPAFNALQETELALPNYLGKQAWEALDARFKTSAPFTPPGETPSTDHMMPRRPAWLKPTDGIDRHRLFERFAGFVTYGSPLDKFAAMWPRVVPLNRQAAVFSKGCEWVNLHDPTDPVAARLDAFEPPQNRADADTARRIALVPQNIASRASWLFGLSHIRYFKPRRRDAKTMPAAIAGALVGGPAASLAGVARKAALSSTEAWVRALAATVQVTAIAVLMAAAAGALLLAIGKALPDRAAELVKQAIGAVCPYLLAMLQAGGWPALKAGAAIVVATALAAVLLAGLVRIGRDALRRPHG